MQRKNNYYYKQTQHISYSEDTYANTYAILKGKRSQSAKGIFYLQQQIIFPFLSYARTQER